MGRNYGQRVVSEDTALNVFSMLNREAQISNLWHLDVLGINDPVAVVSKEAHLKIVKQRFEQTIRVDDDGRYMVNLPWKENHPPLTDNKQAAERRLYTLTNKLNKEGLYEDYQQVFNNWLQEGIIERVERVEANEGNYFLPHRHVVKPNSTTRIRPVFDASASDKNGLSLNQCLETGPNLIQLIPDILLHFRLEKIGLIADITKAFLQISVDRTDRNVLKFLWWDQQDPKKMIVYRHQRVVFGVSSSPFLFGATIEYHLDSELCHCKSQTERDLVKKLKQSFYVDNWVTSVSTLEEAACFEKNSASIMMKAKFELRGWERSEDNPESTLTSVLGISWDRSKDLLSLSTSFIKPLHGSITKRRILATAHKIFDPLGWVSPVLLQPKLMLQRLWSTNIGWDTEVPSDVAEEFRKWYNQLVILQTLWITRWIFGSKEEEITFHMFVDASKHAYAAALFVRVEGVKQTTVHLVQAKSRVGPAQEITIPRMELLAATIDARLMSSILKALDFLQVKVTYWSDSTTVFSWLQRRQQWSRFVRNRVEEIKQLTDLKAWKHVPGIMNPADLPSRGCTPLQLVQSKWWEGPSWLAQPEEKWPQGKLIVDEQLVNSEISKTEKRSTSVLDSNEQTTLTCKNVASREEAAWYIKGSSYIKAVRVIAWMMRFSRNARNKNDRTRGPLRIEETESSERLLLHLSQQESFNGAADQRLKGLSVYVDDEQLIRTKTLISNREDNFDFRYPVVMDPKHKLTQLYIEHMHRRMKHAGITTTVAAVRERLWIISCRKAVRSVVNKCVTCRRYNEKPLTVPPSSLPMNRVRDAVVFEVTGVDFAGPLYLKDGSKAWICLFTCAVYRAVHLELVTAMSTVAFIESLRRFISRRGRPTTIYSDNGKNFVGTNRLLAKLDWTKIKNFCDIQKIDWRLNSPSAAWWGGWWERLIRILKDLLKRTLGKASLHYEEMYTVLSECEATVNARPLTCLPDNKETLIAITPEMFLKEIKETGVPDLDILEKNSISRRLKYRQRLRQELRHRFRSEYLGQLIRYTRLKASPSIKIDDIVLIVNDNLKRIDWPLARILELIPGKDGIPGLLALKLHQEF